MKKGGCNDMGEGGCKFPWGAMVGERREGKKKMVQRKPCGAHGRFRNLGWTSNTRYSILASHSRPFLTNKGVGKCLWFDHLLELHWHPHRPNQKEWMLMAFRKTLAAFRCHGEVDTAVSQSRHFARGDQLHAIAFHVKRAPIQLEKKYDAMHGMHEAPELGIMCHVLVTILDKENTVCRCVGKTTCCPFPECCRMRYWVNPRSPSVNCWQSART